LDYNKKLTASYVVVALIDVDRDIETISLFRLGDPWRSRWYNIG
jgi:hypothetical protein